MSAAATIDPEYVAELERQLAAARALLAASEEANARLERMLAQARHARFGPSSERGDPEQRNLFTEDIEVAEVFGSTAEQRCWFHKTGNVLNAMPKSVQAKAKGHRHDIWQAETKAEANVAFDFFIETYGVKYDKAVAKLVKDRDVLMAFYDFPAEHWKHIRTTNPIESTFATVRNRTGKTKGCLSRKTGLAMAFKLMMSAQGKWRKLDGSNRMPEIIQGIAFVNGIKQLQPAA